MDTLLPLPILSVRYYKEAFMIDGTIFLGMLVIMVIILSMNEKNRS